ncbi:tyrosine-type recombinase/integrase [Burkholderia sp. LMU1-1-1.1]|uniref:tyrosine-type recombinase/integrase n=1 Tax=Burkholderia sp. LMU1-1-1.1 TaxID=3135266 RepID=UPI0034215FAA
MNIYYFDAELTPHLTGLIAQLSLPKGLPYTVDSEWRCDPILNDFFLYLVGPSSRGSATWRTYAEQLSLFFRFLDSRSLSWRDATQDELLHYYRLRRVGEGELKISARSWNVFVAASRRFYEWAVRKGHIPVVPFNYREAQSRAAYGAPGDSVISTDIHEKARQKDIKFLTEEDFRERLLPAVTETRHGIRNALFARLLMRSGLRVSEAIGLKLAKLPDPDNPRYAGRKTCPMEVIGKGQKLRTVRVPKTWLRDAYRYIDWDREDAVETWKQAHPKRNAEVHGHKGSLFLTSAGTQVTYSAMYDMLRTAGAKVGFNFNAHPHMLRHSYAIYQLSAMIAALIEGEYKSGSPTAKAYRRMIQDPLRKLQMLLGHSSITSTFIYLDYVDDIDDIADVTSDEEGFDGNDCYEAVRTTDG